MRLGLLILSENICGTLALNYDGGEWARWFGECLQRHILAIKDRQVPYGTQYRSEFKLRKTTIGFISEYDKNGMPRTAVVYPTDGAY